MRYLFMAFVLFVLVMFALALDTRPIPCEEQGVHFTGNTYRFTCEGEP